MFSVLFSSWLLWRGWNTPRRPRTCRCVHVKTVTVPRGGLWEATLWLARRGGWGWGESCCSPQRGRGDRHRARTVPTPQLQDSSGRLTSFRVLMSGAESQPQKTPFTFLSRAATRVREGPQLTHKHSPCRHESQLRVLVRANAQSHSVIMGVYKM